MYWKIREGDSSRLVNRVFIALLVIIAALSIVLLSASLGRGASSVMGTQLRELQVFVHTETEAMFHRGGSGNGDGDDASSSATTTIYRSGTNDNSGSDTTSKEALALSCEFDPTYRPQTMKVFQVYYEPPTELMEHNRFFLPENAEFAFSNDHEEMEASMREASRMLEACGVVDGAYEAFAGIRAISTRSNIWRAAMLWMYGGLYMDHKVVLMQPLTTFVDFEKDTILLPKDCHHGKDGTNIHPVQTSILWSIAKHPILEQILRLQVERASSHFYGTSPLAVTGPLAFIEAVQQYTGPLRAHRNISFGPEDACMYSLRDTKTFCSESVFRLDDGSGEVVAVWDYSLRKAGKEKSNYQELWRMHQLYCTDSKPIWWDSVDYCKEREGQGQGGGGEGNSARKQSTNDHIKDRYRENRRSHHLHRTRLKKQSDESEETKLRCETFLKSSSHDDDDDMN